MTMLAFDDTGGGRGRALLLVHGFTLDRHVWDDVVPALAVDSRVLCPDLRGFGDVVGGERQGGVVPFG